MRLALVPLLAMLSACTAVAPVHVYDGPQRPLSELAQVQAESEHEHDVMQGLDARMYITHVDGESTFQLAVTAVSDYPEVVYVLPGSHRFRMQWNQLDLIANPEVTFVAKAGRHYKVHKEEMSGRVGVWVEDLATGQKVN